MTTGLYKKGIVLGIICLFVGASFIPSTVGVIGERHCSIDSRTSSMTFNGNTWTVDDEGDGDFIRIQDAIESGSVKDGDTILVYSGTYVENVIVNKQLTLTGIDAELGSGDDTGNPIIDGGEKDDVVYISADKATISGFKIQNSGNNFWDSGIETHSNDNNISDNTISSNEFGIVLWESSNNTVSSNNFISNDWVGIYFRTSSFNVIADNVFSHCGIFVEDSYQNTVYNNWVNGKPLVYLEGEKNKEIDVNAGQIILVNCDDITIQNQVLSDTNDGIELWDTHNCLISNNTISNNNDGIEFIKSTNNVIANNTITSSKRNGLMFMHYSISNTIYCNTISSNDYYGIYISDSNSNDISGNTISGSGYIGIILRYSRLNTVKQNNFITNDGHATFENAFNNKWLNNYWDDHPGSFPPKVIWGIWIRPFRIWPWPNVDWFPSITEWDIC